jgi:two-component system NtrC family response regulator
MAIRSNEGHAGVASSRSGTTAPSRSTAESHTRALSWAIHWVYPRGQIVPLREGTVTVGRDRTCDCVLDDNEISRHHLTLTIGSTGCRFVDHGSSNGTRVNDIRVGSANLNDGDVLRLGSSVGVVVFAVNASTPRRTLAVTEGRSYVGSAKLGNATERGRLLSALTDPVFVHGETGAGKEAIASLLHGARDPARWVSVNCARLDGDLAASEIFGHVRGAFSGAHRDHQGAAQAADGGTLFLDEVAELGPKAQALLLRFLQSGEVTPVGGSRPVHVSARVVTATHADLAGLCRQRAFREDLYHRLSVHVIEVPALRERREDILALFEEHAGRGADGFTPGFVNVLLLGEWRGNVRELVNVAARLRASYGSEPRWDHHLLEQVRPSKNAPAEEPSAQQVVARRLTEEDWKRLSREHRGVAADIARATKLSVSNVKRYLKRHGLAR